MMHYKNYLKFVLSYKHVTLTTTLHTINKTYKFLYLKAENLTVGPTIMKFTKQLKILNLGMSLLKEKNTSLKEGMIYCTDTIKFYESLN
jgi:hypothetical protein